MGEGAGKELLRMGKWVKGKVVDGEDKHHALGGGALSWDGSG